MCVCVVLEGSWIRKTNIRFQVALWHVFNLACVTSTKNKILRFRILKSNPTAKSYIPASFEVWKTEMADGGGCDIARYRDINFPFSSIQDLIILKLSDYCYCLPAVFRTARKLEMEGISCHFVRNWGSKLLRTFFNKHVGHPHKLFRFPSPSLLWRWVGRSGKKKEWTHEGTWVPVKAGLPSLLSPHWAR